MFRPVIVLGFLVLVSQSACLRYVPSRSEIERNYAKDQGRARLAGPTEFLAYEDELRSRLLFLSNQRLALVNAHTDNTYLFGEGDQIEVEVFGLPELSAVVRVNTAGSIVLPLVGEIQVGGKSLEDLRNELTLRLIKYVRQPQVKVAIKDFEANKVSVVGEVLKPGVYPLKRKGQLLTELLSEAGGRTDKASSRLRLIPAENKLNPPQLSLFSIPIFADLEPEVAFFVTRDLGPSGVEIDLEDLLGTIERRPLPLPLLAGDTIVVPEAGAIAVDGEVQKPGTFPLTPRMSVLGAVAAAGGFTYSARVKEVEVVREIGSGNKASMSLDVEEIALNGGKDILLREGDIVRVPSEGGLFAKRQVVEVINSIFKVGVSGSVR